MEGESQEKCLEKTGGERGDGSDVKGKTPSKVAPAKIQDTGKLSIKNTRRGMALFAILSYLCKKSQIQSLFER